MRFFVNNCRLLRHIWTETEESYANILKITHNYQYSFLLSLFGSISHHFKLCRYDIWIYWYFWSKRLGSLGKNVGRWGIYGLKQGIILHNLFQITHNYLIFLSYYHFLIYFLYISRSTELIFDYIDVSVVRGEFICDCLVRIESDMAWNRGIPCKKRKSLRTT